MALQFYIYLTVTLLVITASCARILEHEGRITNGKDAAVGQFPYQVGLLIISEESTYRWCGGVLINKNWVLTSAHCTIDRPRFTVYLGARSQFESEVQYDVTQREVIMHPDYNATTKQNDISLIQIPTVAFTSRVAPVRLPKLAGPHSSYAGEVGIASGWGRTSDLSSEGATILQYAELTVITQEECRNYFSSTLITDAILCAATPGGKSPCNGDSGGPYVLPDEGILIGLTAFGSGRGCQIEYPAAFARITNYLDWIKENTGIAY